MIFRDSFGWTELICVLIAGVLLWQAGCAAATEELAEGAAEGAVTEGLEELDRPVNRGRMQRLMTMPSVSEASRLAALGAARGTYAFMTEELTEEELAQGLATYTGAVSTALLEAVGREFDGQLNGALSDAMQAAVSGAFSPESTAQVSRFAGAVTRATVEAIIDVLSARLADDLGPEVARFIREHVGPASAQAVSEHIGPALADALAEPELQQALASGARSVGRNSIIGVEEGLLEVQERDPDGPLASLGQAVETGEDTLQTLLWMLAVAVLVLLLIVIALGLWLWRTLARTQELAEESKVREEAISDMVRTMQAAEESENVDQLFAQVFDKLGERRGAEYLREKFRHAGLKPPSRPERPS
jgi:uncharacterized protein YneF (UPF0154 family)